MVAPLYRQLCVEPTLQIPKPDLPTSFRESQPTPITRESGRSIDPVVCDQGYRLTAPVDPDKGRLHAGSARRIHEPPLIGDAEDRRAARLFYHHSFFQAYGVAGDLQPRSVKRHGQLTTMASSRAFKKEIVLRPRVFLDT